MLFRSKTAIQIELAMQMTRIRILKFKTLESRFKKVTTFQSQFFFFESLVGPRFARDCEANRGQKTFGRVRKRHLYFFFFSCSGYCSTHNRLTLKPILGHRHHPVLTKKRQSLPILSLRCDSTRRLSKSESFLARTQIV